MRDPRAQKASFSDLRAFAGFCGRLRAFCGRFAGNSGRGKRETVPILKSHKHIGALVVLGDFTKKTSRFTKSKSKPRTTRNFMENESPGNKKCRKSKKAPFLICGRNFCRKESRGIPSTPAELSTKVVREEHSRAPACKIAILSTRVLEVHSRSSSLKFENRNFSAQKWCTKCAPAAPARNWQVFSAKVLREVRSGAPAAKLQLCMRVRSAFPWHEARNS